MGVGGRLVGAKHLVLGGWICDPVDEEMGMEKALDDPSRNFLGL